MFTAIQVIDTTSLSDSERSRLTDLQSSKEDRLKIINRTQLPNYQLGYYELLINAFDTVQDIPTTSEQKTIPDILCDSKGSSIFSEALISKNERMFLFLYKNSSNLLMEGDKEEYTFDIYECVTNDAIGELNQTIAELLFKKWICLSQKDENLKKIMSEYFILLYK